MSSASLQYLVASLGILGPPLSLHVPNPTGPSGGQTVSGDTGNGRIAQDGAILSGAALQRLAAGVSTGGPWALAPVIASDAVQDLLDSTRSAIRREPDKSCRVQANLSPPAVNALLG